MGIRETGQSYVDRVRCVITARAESPQKAILQIAGIDSNALSWYSLTFKQEMGFLYDVVIMGYEVEY
jgi:hypothetical protein